jgi:hypothetical protein
MGRPINKRYFGSTKAATAQSAQNPTVDGKDQAGNTLTSTSSYSEKKLGYNMPVYSARVSNNGTTQTEVQIDPAVSEYPYIVKQKLFGKNFRYSFARGSLQTSQQSCWNISCWRNDSSRLSKR